MFQCVVQLFGFPKSIVDCREVAFDVTDRATLRDVVAGLRKTIPALVGFAITPDADRLVDNFKFNLNGQLIYRDLDVAIRHGDRIALLIPVTGG